MTFEDIISIPKSLILNLRLFPIRLAVKLPILIRYNAVCQVVRGGVKLNIQNIRPAMIKIGFGDIGVLDKKYQRTVINIQGKVIFRGSSFIGEGARISCGRNSVINFGERFRNSGGLSLISEENVTFGDDVLIGWSTNIMDCDYHEVLNTQDGITTSSLRSIKIGDRVWIAMGATILKGSRLAKGCIVGANANVKGVYDEENCLIAGNPARVVKHNVTRKL